MAKILVVEDDDDFRTTLCKFLKTCLHEVDSADSAEAAEPFLTTYTYDVVVLDLNLPGRNGDEICRSLRQRASSVLIIVLSGQRDSRNKAQLLDIGADDYLTKPVDLIELKSRITAILRRKTPFQPNTVVAGPLTIDTLKKEVTLKGEVLDLGRKEFQLLEFFATHPNVVLPPDLIFQRVWSTDSDANLDAVRTSVKRLRQKVDPEGQIIETVYGTGYIFNLI